VQWWLLPASPPVSLYGPSALDASLIGDVSLRRRSFPAILP
jgi:hypothetical protein